MPTQDDLLTYTEEDVTIGASSTSLTLANVLATPPPRMVELFVEDAQIRYRTDGTAPTASVGTILNPFDTVTLTHPSDLWQFRAIRTGGTSATIHARYKR